MKLKIKKGDIKQMIEVEYSDTSEDMLRTIIKENNSDLLNVCFHLSLDNKTPLNNDCGDNFFKYHEIVSGDLLYLLIEKDGTFSPYKNYGSVSNNNQKNFNHNNKNVCENENILSNVKSIYNDTSNEVKENNLLKQLNKENTNSDNLNLNMNDSKFNLLNDQNLSEESTSLDPSRIRDIFSNLLPPSLICCHNRACLELNYSLNTVDLFAVILYVLMAELGFDVIESDGKLFIRSNGSLYKMNFSHCLFVGTILQLLIVPIDNIAIIHGFIKNKEVIIHKIQYNIILSDFINTTENNFTDVNKTYKNSQLIHLSNHFLDNIANPLYQICLKNYGLPLMPELSTLFFDVQLLILKHMDVVSILKLSATSRYWLKMCRYPEIWKKKCIQDFSCKYDLNLQQDWHEFYKEKYKFKKDFSKRKYSPIFYPQPMFGNRPPSKFKQRCFIGGNYDLYPAIPSNPFSIPPIGPLFGNYSQLLNSNSITFQLNWNDYNDLSDSLSSLVNISSPSLKISQNINKSFAKY